MTNKKVDVETERALNDYQEFISTFIDGFTTKLFHDDIINEVSMDQLQKYFANPDDNNGILSDLTEYFHITSGEIHIMFELIESLPVLNYQIEVFDKPESHEKYTAEIERAMHKIKHKPLARDVLKQTAAMGTLVGMWLGNKRNIYPYIFDDPTRVFPAYRRNGDWVVMFDLQQLDEFSDFYREVVFQNLSPYVTRKMYSDYKNSLEGANRYVELPQNRTFVVHTHKLKRNQGLGTGWANSAMFDVLHKRKMKNVERAIANKIINSIAVLTIGNEKDPTNFGNLKLNANMKRKIFSGVKSALSEARNKGVPVVAIPEFAKLDFPDVRADGLDGKKFDHLNVDIQSSLGLSGAMVHGDGGNHASAKLNEGFMYKRIAVMLEQIDTDMLQKLVNLILPAKEKDNYYLTYDKSAPLTAKEKIDVLLKLNDKGFSVKSVVDELDGVDWGRYIEQTLYETDELELQSVVKPYKTSHTQTGDSSEEDGYLDDDDMTDEGHMTRGGGKNDM